MNTLLQHRRRPDGQWYWAPYPQVRANMLASCIRAALLAQGASL